jgi:hypothetical protein
METDPVYKELCSLVFFRIPSNGGSPKIHYSQKTKCHKSLQIEVQNAVSEITEGVVSVLWDTGFSICCENNI